MDKMDLNFEGIARRTFRVLRMVKDRKSLINICCALLDIKHVALIKKDEAGNLEILESSHILKDADPKDLTSWYWESKIQFDQNEGFTLESSLETKCCGTFNDALIAFDTSPRVSKDIILIALLSEDSQRLFTSYDVWTASILLREYQFHITERELNLEKEQLTITEQELDLGKDKLQESWQREQLLGRLAKKVFPDETWKTTLEKANKIIKESKNQEDKEAGVMLIVARLVYALRKPEKEKLPQWDDVKNNLDELDKDTLENLRQPYQWLCESRDKITFPLPEFSDKGPSLRLQYSAYIQERLWSDDSISCNNWNDIISSARGFIGDFVIVKSIMQLPLPKSSWHIR